MCNSVDDNFPRLPCLQVSEADDYIDVDGLNVRESYLEDSNVTSLPGDIFACELNHVRAGTVRATLSALNMRASMRRSPVKL